MRRPRRIFIMPRTGTPSGGGGVVGVELALADLLQQGVHVAGSSATSCCGQAARPLGQAWDHNLVIDLSNLWLTIDESIGHATELDRALGYETGYADT